MKAGASLGTSNGATAAALRKRLVDQREARPAVGDDVVEFGVGKLVVQRDRHSPGPQRREPGDGEAGAIAHEEEHALAGPQAEGHERA